MENPGRNDMQIGVIGLGRMGGNIARRLLRDGHRCVVFDTRSEAVAAVARDGADAADDLPALVAALAPPRVVWVMLAAGAVTEEAVARLAELLDAGDTVIDGGNTYYKDDIRRARELAKYGVHYIDVGTSGGVWGLERGYCLMIGGEAAVVTALDPLFKTLAPGPGAIAPTAARERNARPDGDTRAEHGYIHAGPAGAGHFVKMVHNGIEYGLMQAYAEGFDILRGRGSEKLPADERFDLDLADIAEVWRRGSVITSWLLDLSADALAADGDLSRFSGAVEDSGEGRWTIEAAIEEAVPANVLSAALYARFRSRSQNTFGEKLLSAMRFGFGGHVEPAPVNVPRDDPDR
jgi:6-phosphogluconate dehydrogenase